MAGDDRKKFKELKYAKQLIYFLTLTAIIVFIYFRWDDMMRLKEVPVYYIVWLAIISVALSYLNAYQFNFLLRVFNLKLPFKEWFGISVSSAMYNYILPGKGGLAIRGAYLKEKFKLPYAHYLSLVAGSYLINLMVAGLVAVLLGIWFIVQRTIPLSNPILVVSLIAASSLGALIFININPEKIPKKGKLLSFLHQTMKGFQLFKEQKVYFLAVCAIQFLLIAFTAYRLYLSFYILGFEITYVQVCFIQSLVILSRIISITPGNMGIKEGIIAFTSTAFNVSIDNALLSAVFERIVDMMIIFTLGAVFSRILLDDIGKNDIDSIEKV